MRPQPLAPDTYVRLWVQDDGRGMDARTLTRVFEPYFSGREPRHGAGLGLTLALVLMAGLREETALSDVPAVVKGTALNLLIAGILSLAFMGFAGLFSAG